MELREDIYIYLKLLWTALCDGNGRVFMAKNCKCQVWREFWILNFQKV